MVKQPYISYFSPCAIHLPVTSFHPWDIHLSNYLIGSCFPVAQCELGDCYGMYTRDIVWRANCDPIKEVFYSIGF